MCANEPHSFKNVRKCAATRQVAHCFVHWASSRTVFILSQILIYIFVTGCALNAICLDELVWTGNEGFACLYSLAGENISFTCQEKI